jgi:D-galacturonate reductase
MTVIRIIICLLRRHLFDQIEAKYGLSTACDTFPADDQVDRNAYLAALDTFSPGDLCCVTTPDDTHFDIAMAAIRRGLHCLVCKPLVKTLAQHRELMSAAQSRGVLLVVEYHKRFDPMYSDAVARMRALGGFGFFSSYMSQPKTQLTAFRSWVGSGSDISYYLNSHHIDIHAWGMGGVRPIARVERVQAMASTGVCQLEIGVDAEDTISISAQWRNVAYPAADQAMDSDGKSTVNTVSTVARSPSLGVAVYNTSWAAPKSDVHSQQQFHYMGHKGELRVDQAHRGYTASADGVPLAHINPLYWRYTPDARGRFAGQNTYGYRSFEGFANACLSVSNGLSRASDWDGKTVHI